MCKFAQLYACHELFLNYSHFIFKYVTPLEFREMAWTMTYFFGNKSGLRSKLNETAQWYFTVYHKRISMVNLFIMESFVSQFSINQIVLLIILFFTRVTIFCFGKLHANVYDSIFAEISDMYVHSLTYMLNMMILSTKKIKLKLTLLIVSVSFGVLSCRNTDEDVKHISLLNILFQT